MARFDRAALIPDHEAMLKLLLPALAAILGAVLLIPGLSAQSPANLPYSAIIPVVARDADTAAKPTPPPGPGYCFPPSTSGAPPSPPNAVFGLLTIDGSPAPAGTTVYLTFNGLRGPGVFTTAAGGYRVLYAGGGQGQTPPCINEVGTEMGVLVNGVLKNSGVLVGDPVFGAAFRFDVTIP